MSDDETGIDAEALEHYAATIEGLRSQIDRMERERGDAERRFDALKAGYDALILQEGRLNMEINTALNQRDEARDEVDSLRKRLDGAYEANKRLRGRCQ